jgi:hypothetical protein
MGGQGLQFALKHPRQALQRLSHEKRRGRPLSLIAGALARLSKRSRRVKERRGVVLGLSRAR